MGWHVPVCVCTVQSFPHGVRLTGVQVRVEETSLRDVVDELFGMRPVALEDHAGVKFCDEGVLELEA
jgi:hypothetical protein